MIHRPCWEQLRIRNRANLQTDQYQNTSQNRHLARNEKHILSLPALWMHIIIDSTINTRQKAQRRWKIDDEMWWHSTTCSTFLFFKFTLFRIHQALQLLKIYQLVWHCLRPSCTLIFITPVNTQLTRKIVDDGLHVSLNWFQLQRTKSISIRPFSDFCELFTIMDKSHNL